ncbi:MAG: nickel pincer cofactor biosynthesis protein LarC [Proteobacteria bacterium]|nr:nickel pincer cofactor biosynthesis protein LarC [Pseudomonadota bacterium]MBU1736796.1 nickel pincer cofactor biosynthesis protein LarC [Pseudomonadota bacterium]
MTGEKTAYLDCFAGISGDMFLGALLDCGFPQDILAEQLSTLEITCYKLGISREKVNGISSVKVNVECGEEQPARDMLSIKNIISQSGLPESVRRKVLEVFDLLATAEGKIHDRLKDEVHFHEVGAVDSIIDIVGVVLGMHYLGIENVACSPLPMPSGFVNCQHGLLPLPAPAVCEILKDVPVYGTTLQQELVTPTGAALVKSMTSSFGPFPVMSIDRVGYGCGSHKLTDGRPNLLRLVIGKSRSAAEAQEIEVIETNLDDWSPEGFPMLCETLFSLGALDVILVPIQMKKGRPGFQLQVLSRLENSQAIKRAILAETTAIGLRFRVEQRMTLPRRLGTIRTSLGDLKVKEVETPAGKRLYPEYEECRRVALETGKPLQEIYRAVYAARVEDFRPENG